MVSICFHWLKIWLILWTLCKQRTLAAAAVAAAIRTAARIHVFEIRCFAIFKIFRVQTNTHTPTSNTNRSSWNHFGFQSFQISHGLKIQGALWPFGFVFSCGEEIPKMQEKCSSVSNETNCQRFWINKRATYNRNQWKGCVCLELWRFWRVSMA